MLHITFSYATVYFFEIYTLHDSLLFYFYLTLFLLVQEFELATLVLYLQLQHFFSFKLNISDGILDFLLRNQPCTMILLCMPPL
jgi:hypothetical protein